MQHGAWCWPASPWLLELHHPAQAFDLAGAGGAPLGQDESQGEGKRELRETAGAACVRVYADSDMTSLFLILHTLPCIC